MHYKDSPLYKELFVPRERKFFDDFVFASLPVQKQSLEELNQLVKMNKFKNAEKIINLFQALDKEGNISPRSSGGNQAPKGGGSSKTVFKKNAYRRWKRKGYVKVIDEKEIVVLNGVEYQINHDGRSINLTLPGQTSLTMKVKSNGKRTKTK